MSVCDVWAIAKTWSWVTLLYCNVGDLIRDPQSGPLSCDVQWVPLAGGLETREHSNWIASKAWAFPARTRRLGERAGPGETTHYSPVTGSVGWVVRPSRDPALQERHRPSALHFSCSLTSRRFSWESYRDRDHQREQAKSSYWLRRVGLQLVMSLGTIKESYAG